MAFPMRKFYLHRKKVFSRSLRSVLEMTEASLLYLYLATSQRVQE
jgi:hypothetical protein